ncbi:hypothetical protein [Nocardia macrotermitis]|uniref:Uncharacterized protein n=1 Tax=Nocardia macrotermitis TaxID=2585198 RepID=A0A7K0CVF4_9NOCA|nr:hypothetical protein [Nocardia macrotermitis]MQY17477.1 hypothetical protein [Nocardia macrotermitis]
MILTAVHELVLAQVSNPTPQAPPLAGKFMQLLHYCTWFALLSGTGAIIFAGGRFAWEKWGGGPLESPKMVAGALIGGVVATSAGTLMNSVLGS